MVALVVLRFTLLNKATVMLVRIVLMTGLTPSDPDAPIDLGQAFFFEAYVHSDHYACW